MTQCPRYRRAYAGLAALVLGMLLGVGWGVTRSGPAAVAGVPPPDASASTGCVKKNGSPAERKKCATSTPSPAATATPAPQVTITTGGATPGVGGNQLDPRGQSAGPADAAPAMAGSGTFYTQPPGSVQAAGVADGSGTPAPAWSNAAGPTGTVPPWPVLWTGTAVITLVSAGVLLLLRDRHTRAGHPTGKVDAPSHSEPSAVSGGPIRIAWTEPPN